MSAERVSEFISEIRKNYQGIPNGSPQVEALRHITTLIGLNVGRGGIGNGIMQAIIARRKEDDGIYRDASLRLDRMAAACTGNDAGDKLLGTLASLSNGLKSLVDELYPARPI